MDVHSRISILFAKRIQFFEMFGLKKQTKALFSFSKLILAVFVSLFIRRLLLFLTKCNQDVKYRKRNLIFTFNFGGGASLLDVLLGRGLNVWTVFGRGGRKGCRKSCNESMAYYHHGLHTGYISLCCRMDPAFPIQFLWLIIANAESSKMFDFSKLVSTVWNLQFSLVTIVYLANGAIYVWNVEMLKKISKWPTFTF